MIQAVSYAQAVNSECLECQRGFDLRGMRQASRLLGACGWSLGSEQEASTAYVALFPGLRPRLRIVAWHGALLDRALLDVLVQRAPRWGTIEARGNHHERRCVSLPVLTLQRWGFIPLGPAEDAWWRLDIGPTVRVRRWWSLHVEPWRASVPISEPATSQAPTTRRDCRSI